MTETGRENDERSEISAGKAIPERDSSVTQGLVLKMRFKLDFRNARRSCYKYTSSTRSSDELEHFSRIADSFRIQYTLEIAHEDDLFR